MPASGNEKLPASEAHAKVAWSSFMLFRSDALDQIRHLRESRRDSSISPQATIDKNTQNDTEQGKQMKVNSDADRVKALLDVNVRYTSKSLEAYLNIRRLVLNGDAETGLPPERFTQREHWLNRLINIRWSFERATEAIGFLSYLQINHEYPLGECAVELRHIHKAGGNTCIDENHAITQEAWDDWGKELPTDSCGCAETSAIVRIIGAVLLEGKPYRHEENHAKTVQFISRGLEMENAGAAWVAEGRMPSSRKDLKPFELWLGLDDHQTKFRLWIWVDRSDSEKYVWHLRMEGKLGTLMSIGTIFDD